MVQDGDRSTDELNAIQHADEEWRITHKLATVPAEILDAYEQARVLNRHGALTVDALGEALRWDDFLLRNMAAVEARDRPGTAVELELLDRVLNATLQAATGRVENAPSAMRDRQILFDWFMSADTEDFRVVEFSGDAYIQWQVETDVVRLEISGSPELGGPDQVRIRLGSSRGRVVGAYY